MAYWTGLVEGFQSRRENELLKNYQLEQQNRQMADRVYTHLLQSRDPQMQEMALSALASPMQKKKGLAGFLGGVESNPMMAQIIARMNEMVPDEGMGGGPSPPTPGSAAMSTNQPVRAGSQPLQPMPAGGVEAMQAPPAMEGGGPAGPPPLGPQAVEAAPGVGMPPPAPPESKWKRRGTGVPTAEEIAEASANAQMEGRIKAVTRQLQAAGATPEEIEQAVLGMAGAPRNQRMLSAVTGWGVQLTPEGPVVPVLLDQNKGYVTAGGQPIPPTANMVRMTGGGTVPRRNIQADSASPTGYSAVYSDTNTGEEMYRIPTEFVPPPAFSGTGEIAEPGTGIPTRVQFPREGGAPVPIGDAPGTVPSKLQTDAKALIDIVNRRMTEERRPGLPVRPGQRDLVTREEARKLGLGFTSYAEAVRASTSTPEVTPRERLEGGSAAERVRRRLEGSAGGGVTPPPARPPARQMGPGPNR